jgi:hypothetical protein
MKRVRAKAVLTLALAIATSLVAAAASLGNRADDLFPPAALMRFSATPAPIPVPSEGRIPVSLRLATSIEIEGGSHQPPAKELRFEFDHGFQLALADVPTCPSGVRSQSRTGESPCPEARVASGRSRWDVAFPGQEPVQVAGRTTAYKIAPRKLVFHVFLEAPVTADVFTTVELSRAPRGDRYGLRATATIPKVAGGYGSLVDLRLRFRKGLFSLACPQRKVQSRLTADFVDGTRLIAAHFITC